MQGTMTVPGLASVDGKVQGQLTADVVAIQSNGSIDGKTTANHVKVAGSLTDTTVANKTLVVESSGLIAGSITYTEMEIKKGGSLQGSIHKIGKAMPNFSDSAPMAAPSASGASPSSAVSEVGATDNNDPAGNP